jgi:hypothetical protein
MAGKQVTELDALPSFTDNSLLPVHNGAGLKKGLLSQLANYLGTKFSNPNLLINPNFKINQRGSVNYARNGYTVDRWKITNGVVKPQSNGIIVTLNNEGLLTQSFENALSGTYTATIKVTSITGDCVLSIGSHSLQLNKAGTFSITENGSIADISLRKTTGTCTIAIEWIKLEQGSVATHFVEPNKAEELAKCQYYTVIFEPWRTILNANTDSSVINIDTRCKMRTKPTVSYITLKSGTQNQFNFVSILSSKAYYALKTNNWTSFIDSKNEVVVVNTGSGISSGAFGQVTFDNSLMLDAEIY